MKKFYTFILMAAALVACTGIEQPELVENPDASKTYTMTVKASKTVDTKALTLTGSTLTAKWAENEEVKVYEGSTLLGSLYAQELTNNGASCSLRGTLDNAPSGSGVTLTLKFNTASYGGQDGTLDYIANHCDYAEATTTVTIDGSTITGTTASFTNHQAIVKFTLVDKGNNETKLNASQLVVKTDIKQSIYDNYPYLLTIRNFLASEIPEYTLSPDLSIYDINHNGNGVIYLAFPDKLSENLNGLNSAIHTYIPSYSNLTLTRDDFSFTLTATVDGETYTYTRNGIPFENGKYYEITVKMRPEETVNGLFTVNGSGKKVYFSKGNLQAVFSEAGSMIDKPSICTWKFADNQLIYVGNSAANTSIDGYGSVSAAGTVDLFGYSAFDLDYLSVLKANSYGICNADSNTDNWMRYYGSREASNKVDWGKVFGTDSPWFTLTKNEWIWLLGPVNESLTPGTNCRVTSTINEVDNALYAPLKVDSYYGIIIFPDTFTYPSEVTPINNINVKEVTWSNITSLTTSEWAALEEAGAVFLTIGGEREGTSVKHYPGWNDYNYRKGYYWTGDYSMSLSFGGFANDSWSLHNYSTSMEYLGYSVRLVRNAN